MLACLRCGGCVVLSIAAMVFGGSSVMSTRSAHAQSREESATPPLDYTADVRPILSDRCFFCHGPDAERREADLRLDVQEAAHEYAIVPGDPDASEVIARVFSEDPELLMPPPASKIALTERERQILRRWIEQGAEYEAHWAFVPVAKPSTENAGGQSPVDQLVQAKLAEHALELAPEADRATLIRRLSFDLTGLPPTIDQVDAFVKDTADDAYERLVDALLSSERFGERMATDWLDVARYADTYGYQNDRYRDMWPWRDWVIRAFNDNLPYDDFIRWQIAGDLLPNASRDQILATAFNRNHRQTNEGGSVEEEFRAEYVADRVNTFGAAFLGLTLECSRCHDHKYDPISQREYYQLAAFFNSIDESGLYSHFTQATPTPTLQLSSEQQATELEELREKIHCLQQELDEFSVQSEQYAAWRNRLVDVRPAPAEVVQSSKQTASVEAFQDGSQSAIKLRKLLEDGLRAGLVGDFPLDDLEGGKPWNRVSGKREGGSSDQPQLQEGKVGSAVLLSGDNSVQVDAGGAFTRNQPFSLSLWVKAPTAYERAVLLHRSRAWTDSGSRGYELLIEEGTLSAALIHFWPGNALRVVSEEPLPLDRWVQIGWTYDGSSRAQGLKLYMDGRQVATRIVRNKLNKHIKGADGFGGGGVSNVTVGQRFRDKGFKGGQVDELKIFDRELTELEMQLVAVTDATPNNVSEVLHNLDERLLKDHFRTLTPRHQELVAEVRTWREKFSQANDPIPEIMVMRELPRPRATYVLTRGAYDAPAEEVTRGTPQAILPMEWGKSDLDRRDLANWLVDRQHPLTARVAVNRFWQGLFGVGLVETAEDFGLQGELPIHRSLLDWLAAEFMDSGWDVKGLLKTIVMSRTYRQRSDPSPDLLALDPQNRLLARGPAVRLPAEMIRDLALASGGLLVEKIGGPPVKPYQPPGLWKEKSGTAYQRDVNEGSHRRSLYTYWKRTSPPPAMMALDASNREVCVVRRQVTLTPMQVLVLMNDPQYVEAAKGLAERAMEHTPESSGQLDFAFRTLVARQPDAREMGILAEMLDAQRMYFEANPTAADKLLEVGDHKPNPELEKTSLAALTVVAQGLLSFDETVMKR